MVWYLRTSVFGPYCNQLWHPSRNESITIMNKKGDNGSLCLTSLGFFFFCQVARLLLPTMFLTSQLVWYIPTIELPNSWRARSLEIPIVELPLIWTPDLLCQRLYWCLPWIVTLVCLSSLCVASTIVCIRNLPLFSFLRWNPFEHNQTYLWYYLEFCLLIF